MYNSIVLSVALRIIPMLAIGFVGLLLLYKIYIKVRSKFPVKVNCWFCNQNTKVPYHQYNSWTCTACDQYNGFTKDGDYNREIYEQKDCSTANGPGNGSLFNSCKTYEEPRNGFCHQCNEAQRLKVEKLSQFEPKNESKFDAEFKVYKTQLEEMYRLCETCDRHLKKVLREKKKMVLGSKFLDFIIKGASSVREPHFQHLRQVRKQQLLQRSSIIIGLLCVINLACLMGSLPIVKLETCSQYLGTGLGHYAFLALTHFVTLCRVLSSYGEALLEHEVVAKSVLFMRTVVMMVLYSMGLKWPQVIELSFKSLYLLVSPFSLLALTFVHNLLDGIKLSRYTLLLVLWSSLAGGLANGIEVAVPQSVLMFMASVITLLLTTTNPPERSTKLEDDNSSFHKICSEDYLSDEDTMSLLSEKLDSSNQSIRSNGTMRSFVSNNTQQTNLGLHRPPRISLQQRPFYANTMSHNSSFQTSYGQERPDPSNGWQRSSVLFPSQLDLATDRGQSPAFNQSVNGCNNTFANSTFREPHEQTMNMDNHQQLNGSFVSSMSLGGFTNNTQRAQAAMVTPTPLHSPFSVSSSAIHQSGRNFLTPSRFSQMNLNQNSPASSWLSGGYFNRRPVIHTALTDDTGQIPNGFYNSNIGGINTATMDENLSRASSHSSGFESQPGRESSQSRELTATQEVNKGLGGTAMFQPIEPSESAFPLTRSSALYSPMAPSSTGLFGEPTIYSELKRRPHFSQTPTICRRDSFNLRRINEELPVLKPGDLSRKWQQQAQLNAKTCNATAFNM